MKTVIIPDVEVVRADWGDELAGRMANEEQLDLLWRAVADIHAAARWVAAAGPATEAEREARRREVAERYEIVRDLLCVSPVGKLALWPDDFWPTSLGKLIFYAFYVTHEELLLPKQVGEILGMSVQRVGHLQALGLLDYIVDADAAHPRQYTRRVTRRMIDDYLRYRATPQARRRKEEYGKEASHVTPF